MFIMYVLLILMILLLVAAIVYVGLRAIRWLRTMFDFRRTYVLWIVLVLLPLLFVVGDFLPASGFARAVTLTGGVSIGLFLYALLFTAAADLLALLASKLNLKSGELNPGGRYHMMRSLMHFPQVRPDLESNVPPPLAHPDLTPFSSILKVVKKKDILLHFPYHSFNHMVDFLGEAAIDPKVTDISITLYRL